MLFLQKYATDPIVGHFSYSGHKEYAGETHWEPDNCYACQKSRENYSLMAKDERDTTLSELCRMLKRMCGNFSKEKQDWEFRSILNDFLEKEVPSAYIRSLESREISTDHLQQNKQEDSSIIVQNADLPLPTNTEGMYNMIRQLSKQVTDMCQVINQLQMQRNQEPLGESQFQNVFQGENLTIYYPKSTTVKEPFFIARVLAAA